MRFRLFISLVLLTLSLAVHAVTFDVTGLILGISQGGEAWILLNGDVTPNNFNVNVANLANFHCGDVIRAIGFSQTKSPTQVNYLATNITLVGKGSLPKTIEITGNQINDHNLLHKCVHLKGVVSSVVRDDTNNKWNQITLRTETGKVCAVVQDDVYPLAELIHLVDAEVVLSGYVTRFGTFLRFLGNELMLFGREGVTVIHPANPDPFVSPELATTNSLHRQRVQGIVFGKDRNRFYIATPQDDFLPVLVSDGQKQPAVGTTVTVVGFVENGMRRIQLANALVRTDDTTPQPLAPASDIDPEILFRDTSAADVTASNFYGRPIRIRGVISNTPDNIGHDQVLQLACGRRTITADISQLNDMESFERLTGCTIDMAGLCLPRFERDAASSWIPRFEGFTLIPRTPADITILSRPSWWTTFKLVCVIGTLLVLIVAILIWNQTLRVMSERRGKNLAREQVEHLKADLKVEERTRLAVELHDSISQTLTGVALQIDSAATANASANTTVDRYLSLARQMLLACRKELQGCLWDLRSRTFEEKDLNEAVLRAIGPQIGKAKVLVRFNVPREIISETTLHTVLRVVRELVSNAVHHGSSTRIRIAGEYRDGLLRFSVRDNGCSFDPATAPGPVQGHFGLRGIRERLADFNGTLQTESHPGDGTRSIVTLHIDKEESS